MMTLIMMFSFLDRGLLSLLVEPIKEDLGISDTQMSLLLGFAFASFYALLGVPFGILADRSNRVKLIGFGLFCWTVATALSGRAQSFLMLFLLRMGVGFGEATLGPSAPSIITDFRAPGAPRDIDEHLRDRNLHRLGSGDTSGWRHCWNCGQDRDRRPAGPRPGQTVADGLPDCGSRWLPASLAPSVHGARAETPGRGSDRASTGSHADRVPLSFTPSHHHLPPHWFRHARLLRLRCRQLASRLHDRKHGWSIQQVALWLGLNGIITAVVGVLVGGFLADALVRRGKSDCKLRVAVLGAIVWFPFGIAYPLLESDVLTMAALAGATFCSAIGVGCALATLQEIMPNRMRGQAGALYAVLANFFGLGFGPLAVALLTDRVFQDPAKIGSSLLIVGFSAHVVAAIALVMSLRPYRASLVRLGVGSATPAAES